MQDNIVISIRQGAKDVLFRCAGFGQQLECLIAVAGKYHLVIAFAACGAVDSNALVIAFHSDDWTVKADLFGKACTQGFYIGAGATFYHPPLRAMGDA